MFPFHEEKKGLETILINQQYMRKQKCTSLKRSYKTKKRALEAKGRYEKLYEGKEYCPYKCNICRNWHLTTTGKEYKKHVTCDHDYIKIETCRIMPLKSNIYLKARCVGCGDMFQKSLSTSEIEWKKLLINQTTL